MTKGEGACRIDAVEVLEVSLDLTSGQPRLSAKYAYADSTSTERLGFGHRNQAWGAETLEAVESLLRSMEEDIAKLVFRAGPPADGGTPANDTTTDGVPSL